MTNILKLNGTYELHEFLFLFWKVTSTINHMSTIHTSQVYSVVKVSYWYRYYVLSTALRLVVRLNYLRVSQLLIVLTFKLWFYRLQHCTMVFDETLSQLCSLDFNETTLFYIKRSANINKKHLPLGVTV